MSEPKFTKGPWHCDEYDDWAIRGMDKVRTAPPERELSSCVVCTVNSWLAGGVANVALIKSAPEMYEMLEYWLKEAIYSMNFNIARWIRAGLSKESLLEDAKTKKGH